MGLVLVKHFISAHHTSFVVFALNWELAAAFLLLKVEAHFWVLVDDTLHPVFYSLLVDFKEIVERKKVFSRASFEVKVKKGLHDGTCGLHFLITDL